MQRIAIVVNGDQRLQGGADVVEIHFLGVQRTARSLNMVFQLLAALVGAVLVAHGRSPDPPRHPTHHRIFRVHAVAEEERQIRGEVVDVHSARQIGFDVGEAVGQGKGQLRNRIGAGLGDVIAGNRDRVKFRTP